MLALLRFTDRETFFWIRSVSAVLMVLSALLFATPYAQSVNQYPYFFPNPYMGAAVGYLLEFQLDASDPDGDPLTWDYSGLPPGAEFDLSTHTFSWTPLEGDEGEYEVAFTVDDGRGGVVSRTISIQVVQEGEWFLQYKTSQDKHFFDACFVDANTGWAVGYQAIYKTTDGGATWFPQYSGRELKGVQFLDANTGWVVGRSGTILKTTDGGETWTYQNSGTNHNLLDLHFIGSSTGWVIGGTDYEEFVLKTTDGGLTWTSHSSGASGLPLAVYFVDENRGYVTGYDGWVRKTMDGGVTWEPVHRIDAVLMDVHFVNASLGWVVGGGGKVAKTADGGATWQDQTPSWIDPGSEGFADVFFLDEDTGWIVGQGGRIIQTTDGGVSWTAQYAPTGATLNTVHFVDVNTGWALGYLSAALKTTDGGASWQPQLWETGIVYAIDFVDPLHGWATGKGALVLYTSDGGNTWTHYSTAGTGNAQRFYDIQFLDVDTGWMVGDGGRILHTSDGGVHWVKQTALRYKSLYDIHLVDAHSGWVVGYEGTIVNTSDGGENWNRQVSGTVARLNGVHFISHTVGWVVGDGGVILNTKDGGNTWIAQNSGSTSFLADAQFLDETTGWVVGDGGTILKTTDGGETWVPLDGGTVQNLKCLAFLNHRAGWIGGDNGTFLHTMDGGQTWSPVPVGNAYFHYWALDFVDTAGWVAAPRMYSGQHIFKVFLGEAFGTTFAEVGGEAGVDDMEDGVSAAWGDYDLDNDLDLYVTNSSQPNLLYHNDDGAFTEMAGSPDLDDAGDGTGSLWADYDNDGDLDLYVVNANQPNRLYRNDDGDYVDVAPDLGVADDGDGRGAAWMDYDNDGDLDLYVANANQPNRLYRNDGEMFVDVAGIAGVADEGDGRSVAWVDYDDDGDLDLYVVNANQPNRLYRNDSGAFLDVAPVYGVADEGDGTAAAWGDYDNDGDLDLCVGNRSLPSLLLYRNEEDLFAEVAGTMGMGGLGNVTDVAWADHDNDGDLDLFVARDQEINSLYVNDGNAFEDLAIPEGLGDEVRDTRATAWADYDNDGDLDLYVVDPGGQPNQLYQNAGNINHWLIVKLMGVVSNRDGIGARLKLYSGDLCQVREVSGGDGRLSQDSPEVEFGLGAYASIDSLVILWPSGIVQSVYTSVDRKITVVEEDTGLPPSTEGGVSLVWGTSSLRIHNAYYDLQISRDTGRLIHIRKAGGTGDIVQSEELQVVDPSGISYETALSSISLVHDSPIYKLVKVEMEIWGGGGAVGTLNRYLEFLPSPLVYITDYFSSETSFSFGGESVLFHLSGATEAQDQRERPMALTGSGDALFDKLLMGDNYLRKVTTPQGSLYFGSIKMAEFFSWTAPTSYISTIQAQRVKVVDGATAAVAVELDGSYTLEQDKELGNSYLISFQEHLYAPPMHEMALSRLGYSETGALQSLWVRKGYRRVTSTAPYTTCTFDDHLEDDNRAWGTLQEGRGTRAFPPHDQIIRHTYRELEELAEDGGDWVRQGDQGPADTHSAGAFHPMVAVIVEYKDVFPEAMQIIYEALQGTQSLYQVDPTGTGIYGKWIDAYNDTTWWIADKDIQGASKEQGILNKHLFGLSHAEAMKELSLVMEDEVSAAFWQDVCWKTTNGLMYVLPSLINADGDLDYSLQKGHPSSNYAPTSWRMLGKILRVENRFVPSLPLQMQKCQTYVKRKYAGTSLALADHRTVRHMLTDDGTGGCAYVLYMVTLEEFMGDGEYSPGGTFTGCEQISTSQTALVNGVGSILFNDNHRFLATPNVELRTTLRLMEVEGQAEIYQAYYTAEEEKATVELTGEGLVVLHLTNLEPGISYWVRRNGYDYRDWEIQGDELIVRMTLSGVTETIEITLSPEQPSGIEPVVYDEYDESAPGGWDPRWRYRVRVDIDAGEYDRHDAPVIVPVDFGMLLTDLGKAGVPLDPASVRGVEETPIGPIEVPSWFEKPVHFDPVELPRGHVVWMLAGDTPAGGQRTFYLYFDTLEHGGKHPPAYWKWDMNSGAMDIGNKVLGISHIGSHLQFRDLQYEGEPYVYLSFMKLINGGNHSFDGEFAPDWVFPFSRYPAKVLSESGFEIVQCQTSPDNELFVRGLFVLTTGKQFYIIKFIDNAVGEAHGELKLYAYMDPNIGGPIGYEDEEWYDDSSRYDPEADIVYQFDNPVDGTHQYVGMRGVSSSVAYDMGTYDHAGGHYANSTLYYGNLDNCDTEDNIDTRIVFEWDYPSLGAQSTLMHIEAYALGDDYQELRETLMRLTHPPQPVFGEVAVCPFDDTAPGVAEVIFPEDGIVVNYTRRPALRWTVPSDADGDSLHFKVEIARDGSFSEQIPGSPFSSVDLSAYFTPSVPAPEGEGQLRFTPPEELEDGRYWWRVTAWDGMIHGEPSIPAMFEIDLTSRKMIRIAFHPDQWNLRWSNDRSDKSAGSIEVYIGRIGQELKIPVSRLKIGSVLGEGLFNVRTILGEQKGSKKIQEIVLTYTGEETANIAIHMASESWHFGPVVSGESLTISATKGIRGVLDLMVAPVMEFSVHDIDVGTLLLNETLSPLTISRQERIYAEVLSRQPGFVGEVLHVKFRQPDAIGVLGEASSEDLAVVTITGQLNSGVGFIGGTEVKIIGGENAKSVARKLPDTYALLQSYPNPFNPQTCIRYQLPQASYVRLEIYNTLGQMVRQLIDEKQAAGYHLITWDGRDRNGREVGSGQYFYRLRAGRFTAIGKMILIR